MLSYEKLQHEKIEITLILSNSYANYWSSLLSNNSFIISKTIGF